MAFAMDDRIAFLQALGRQLSTRLVVFVPTGRKARSTWLNGTGAQEEITELTAIGRAWLDPSGHQRTLSRPDEGAELLDDATILLAPAWSDHGVTGALVARKEPGSVWTANELAVVRFVIDYHAALFDGWATRPTPALSIAQDTTLAPLEAGLDTAMRRAMGNGELIMRYQPEIDLRDGTVVAIEALVRWNHPSRGELGPESFIAVAERSDLIKLLGSWVIDESLREFSTLSRLRSGLSLRVNVSPLQIGGDLVAQFADALVKHDVPGEQVCVEITENVLAADTALAASTLQALKRLGIRSAIDDLASGYSSLTRLRALPVDVVKIDRGLVSGIDTDARAQAIVSTLITLADLLETTVVAEGVETAEEAAMLLDLGCPRAQGHHFGRPMTAAELTGFLRVA